jgi:Nif-specific ferredoxin III
MTCLTGLTRGGREWTPQFVTALDESSCIGCGRCFKICPRDVFALIERDSIDDEDDDDEDDAPRHVMTLNDPLDCIGCGSCARSCPKKCLSHEAIAA